MKTTEMPTDKLNQAFVDGYEAGYGTLDPERLRLYQAHKRFAKVHRTACGLRPGAPLRSAQHMALVMERHRVLGLPMKICRNQRGPTCPCCRDRIQRELQPRSLAKWYSVQYRILPAWQHRIHELTDGYPTNQVNLSNSIRRCFQWFVVFYFNQADMFGYLFGLIDQNRIGSEPGWIPAISASPRGLLAPPSLLCADV